MRIVAWNCGDAFAKKSAALSALMADVSIVSEVRPSALARAEIAPDRYVWSGKPGGKGLSVICKPGWTIRAEPIADADMWYVTAVVESDEDKFQVLGVWAQHKGVVGDPTFRTITRCASFLRRCPTIIAGDFNNNINWDRGKRQNRFSDSLSLISELGFMSAWHTFKSENQGDESAPTLYWRRSNTQTYHIDYVFLPDRADWKPQFVEIGSYADWVATGLSDHAPVIVTV